MQIRKLTRDDLPRASALCLEAFMLTVAPWQGTWASPPGWSISQWRGGVVIIWLEHML